MTHLRSLCVGLMIALSVSGTLAQERWTWPDKPKALRVLPRDFDGTQLRSVMTGFTRALGVRCSYCHEGEDGQPLSTYNFVSDDNPNKERARNMLTMLGDINSHLRKMSKSGDTPVNMWCHTCHRGRPKPMTLEEEMSSVYRTQGAQAAVAHYGTLKDRYYGRGVYNFGESSLNAFGYEILNAGDTEGAVLIFALNTKQFPTSANAWDSLAEASMKAGDLDHAREYYEKSIRLNPKNPNARNMLEKLSKQQK